MMVSLAMGFVVLTFSSLEEPMTFVFLRGLLEKDSELLLKWRNDPDTRGNSLHTEEVSPEDHVRWFQNAMVPEHDHQSPAGSISCHNRGRTCWRHSFRLESGTRYLRNL
jgi:hypothetical protein